MSSTSDRRSNATKIALVSGATVAEGVAAATKVLGLPEEMIRLQVVGKHRTGLFGLGDVVIDFEATSAEDEVHDAADVLLGEPSKSDQALAVASNTIMVSAATVAEAAVAASKALGASEDRIVLRVVGKHRSGLFGLGDLVIDFEASVSPTGLLDAPSATRTESTVPLPAVAAVPAPALSIVFREGRVSLTASRPNNSQRRATVVDVDKILTGMPLGARDSEGVADALMRQTGRPVVVGTISATTPPDPSDPIGVYVTKDGLTAWAIPWRDGPLTAEVFDQIINRAGINYGVDQEVRRALLADRLELPVVIARGSQPIPGIDAVVDFRIPKPGTVRDLGGDDQNIDSRKVDHKEVDTGSISAQVGDVLAIKRPMSNATDGVGVSGESIPGVASKDFDLSKAAGKGAVVSEDGLRIEAAILGSASWAGDRLVVAPVTTVSGDVDFGSGNLHVVGDVMVTGSVMTGFLVEATGNVSVVGVIEGATVRAGGNVVVNGGVLGHDLAEIEAGGTVSARFIDSATVRAGGDVSVALETRRATIFSDGFVRIGSGRAGRVAGGHIRGREGVEATELGTDGGTPTVVQTGWGRELDPNAVPVNPQIIVHTTANAGVRITIGNVSQTMTAPTPAGHWHVTAGSLVFVVATSKGR